MDVLILRLEAPLMSFGGVAVDNIGVLREPPSKSTLTGLLANALGYDHADDDLLQRLQDRLRIAARRDRAGELVTDYQTADLGQRFLVGTGWTTHGAVENRSGGSAREGTHIRYREYLADAIFTVAVTLVIADEEPDLARIEVALRCPARPLFLGRKPCLPSSRLLASRMQSPTLRKALETVPRHPRSDAGDLAAWWPIEPGDRLDAPEPGARFEPVFDERDWSNQVHTGRRFIVHGSVHPPDEQSDVF